MAKKEIKTDLWVARQLDDSKIKYDAQASNFTIRKVNYFTFAAGKYFTKNSQNKGSVVADRQQLQSLLVYTI